MFLTQILIFATLIVMNLQMNATPNKDEYIRNEVLYCSILVISRLNIVETTLLWLGSV